MINDSHTSSTDAALTKLLTSPASEAAVEVLHQRHRSAVVSYAYACCRTSRSAEDLTAEAFARVLRAVRSGSGPKHAWRPYLLTIIRRTAATWADSGRRTDLSPEFARWLADLPASLDTRSCDARMLLQEDSSLVLHAFGPCPSACRPSCGTPRWKGTLPGTSVACSVWTKVMSARAPCGPGRPCVSPALPNSPTAPARTDAAATAPCSALSYAAQDAAAPRTSTGICRSALSELTDLNEQLGSALSAAVLLWGSRAYLAARLTEANVWAAGTPRTSKAQGGGSSADRDRGAGWGLRASGSPLRSATAAGAVAAVGLAALVLPIRPNGQDGVPSSTQADATRTRTVVAYPPPVTITARPFPHMSSRLAEPSLAAPSRTASHRASAPPSGTAPAGPSAVPRAHLGSVGWTGILRNARFTMQCLEPLGAGVVHSTCNGGQTQLWETLSFQPTPGYSLLRNAATGECIDYHAAIRGVDYHDVLAVGMRPCRADGEGQLFQFAPYSSARTDAGGGSYAVRATLGNDSTSQEPQLGVPQSQGRDAPTATATPVALVRGCFFSPQLRYFAEGASGSPYRPPLDPVYPKAP